MRNITISDHALLRYLERIIGLDMEAYRERLAQEIAGAAAVGAKSYTVQGTTFILAATLNGGVCVATVLTEKMHKTTMKRQSGVAARRKA